MPSSASLTTAPSTASRALRLLQRALLALAALAVVGTALFVAIRYYHVGNQVGRWLRGHHVGQPWNDGAAWGDRSRIWLPDYAFDIENKAVAGIDRNLSGLAWDGDRGRLLASVNRPATLVALDAEGAVQHRWSLADSGDAEGIAYLGDGRAAVLLEGQRALKIFRVPDAATPGTALRAERTVQLDLPDSGNDGPEGLAYDRATDTLYIAKERAPRGLYMVHGLRAQRSGSAVTLDRSDWLAKLPFATDLASVEFDPASRHLLLLSDESRMLVEITNDGQPVSTLTLAASPGRLPAPQPEGVAVDDAGTIYVVSEPNLFYRLRPRAQSPQ